MTTETATDPTPPTPAAPPPADAPSRITLGGDTYAVPPLAMSISDLRAAARKRVWLDRQAAIVAALKAIETDFKGTPDMLREVSREAYRDLRDGAEAITSADVGEFLETDRGYCWYLSLRLTKTNPVLTEQRIFDLLQQETKATNGAAAS